jgi:branched-chain amino acid transport system substrate-binding protein
MPRLRTTLAGLVALAIVAGACGGGDGDGDSAASTSTTAARAGRTSARDGTLALGQLAPQTGALTPIAKSLTAPVQIAVNEINAGGGVLDRPVRLTAADDASGGQPGVAEASLRRLRSTDRVDAVVGPSASGTALDLLDDIRDAGPLMCSGSNSVPELSTADSGGFYFRTAPPDRLQAIALARLFLREGRRRPALVARNDPYGDAFVRGVVRELRRADVDLAGPVVRFDPEAEDLAPVAKTVARQRPDAVIGIALADDGARLVNALAGAGVGPAQQPFYAADGMQSTMMLEKVGAANTGALPSIRGTAPAASPVGGESTFAAAMRRAGAEPIFSAYYYDCTILTALAAVQAKSDDPARMRHAFAKSLRGRNDCATYVACLQLLGAGKSIHYRGASSRFDRWDRHEPGEGVYDRWVYGPDGRVATGSADQQVRVP